MSLREKMKAALAQRTEESYSRKDQSGKFKSIFRGDVTDLKMFKVTSGEHIIDIIPYCAGENDPHVKVGEPTYALEVYQHSKVGENEDTIICLARTYGLPCPICEEQNRLRAEGADEEIIKSLKPGRRMLYNIVCYDSNKEEEKGIQIWDSSHWLFERLIVPLAKKPRRQGGGGSTGYIAFADPDEGKSIRFEKTGERLSTDYIGHQFLDRDYVITDELLDSAKVLDDIIHVPTYEEVADAFFGKDVQHDESVAKVAKVATTRTAMTAESVKEVVETATRRSAATRLNPPITEKVVETAAVVEPEKTVAAEPVTRTTRTRAAVVETATTETCPGGGVFGVDLDQLKSCETCNVWEKCAAEVDKKEAAKRA